MNIVYDWPPNIKQIREIVSPGPETVFTYGNTLYVPTEAEIPQELMAHERHHSIQQAKYPGGPDAWWMEYLKNPKFRAEQEAQGYQKQYKAFCETEKNIMVRYSYLTYLADLLSGPMYGHCITKVGAMAKIRSIMNK